MIGDLENRHSHHSRRIEVLTICDTVLDSVRLQAILGHTNWVVHCARSLHTATELLQSRAVPVVICASDFSDGTWKHVLNIVRGLPQPCKLVVYTGAAGERTWPQILDAGAHDVLSKPFHPADVYEVISSAYRAWDKEAIAGPVLAHH